MSSTVMKPKRGKPRLVNFNFVAPEISFRKMVKIEDIPDSKSGFVNFLRQFIQVAQICYRKVWIQMFFYMEGREYPIHSEFQYLIFFDLLQQREVQQVQVRLVEFEELYDGPVPTTQLQIVQKVPKETQIPNINLNEEKVKVLQNMLNNIIQKKDITSTPQDKLPKYLREAELHKKFILPPKDVTNQKQVDLRFYYEYDQFKEIILSQVELYMRGHISGSVKYFPKFMNGDGQKFKFQTIFTTRSHKRYSHIVRYICRETGCHAALGVGIEFNKKLVEVYQTKKYNHICNKQQKKLIPTTIKESIQLSNARIREMEKRDDEIFEPPHQLTIEPPKIQQSANTPVPIPYLQTLLEQEEQKIMYTKMKLELDDSLSYNGQSGEDENGSNFLNEIDFKMGAESEIKSDSKLDPSPVFEEEKPKPVPPSERIQRNHVNYLAEKFQQLKEFKFKEEQEYDDDAPAPAEKAQDNHFLSLMSKINRDREIFGLPGFQLPNKEDERGGSKDEKSSPAAPPSNGNLKRPYHPLNGDEDEFDKYMQKKVKND